MPWDNELDTILRQQGITTLLFAGVNTDRCVFSSLQDAAFLGYDCVLLGDACSTQLHGQPDGLLTALAEVRVAPSNTQRKIP